jgi:hypothetical protein
LPAVVGELASQPTRLPPQNPHREREARCAASYRPAIGRPQKRSGLSVLCYRELGKAGTSLAVKACMAKIVGAAGAHAGKQSVAAFKKMFATVLIVVAVIAFAEGVMLTSLVTLHGRLSWYLIPAGVGLLMVWIVRIANFRVKKHETDRMKWRKGALGEYEVGAELERLPDDYLVFNDINTEEFGNFDHIVVGPKGIFAVETKNWTGLIGTNAAGELTRNGKPLWRSHIRMLERKVMMLREQILVLTRRDDLFIRGLMVFPKACLEASAKTRNIHCLSVEKVYDYFDNVRKACSQTRSSGSPAP